MSNCFSHNLTKCIQIRRVFPTCEVIRVCKKFKWKHTQTYRLKFFKTTPRSTVSKLRAEIKLSMSPRILHFAHAATCLVVSQANLRCWFYQSQQESIASGSQSSIFVCRIPDFSNRRTSVGEVLFFPCSRGARSDFRCTRRQNTCFPHRTFSCIVLRGSTSSRFTTNRLDGSDLASHNILRQALGVISSRG